MALITCKECGQRISDKAVACPHCGARIAALSEVHSSTRTTIKGLCLVSCVIGIVMAIAGYPMGIILLLGGFLTMVVVRISE